MSATCSTCNAPVLWVWTALGKKMPLDAEPNERGNIGLDAHGFAVVLDMFSASDVVRYTSHFASCPQAAQHRRKT